jgi:ketol-acid reductoisomerase
MSSGFVFSGGGMFLDTQVNEYLKKKTVAVLGFDAGGHEQALTLIDQGFKVVVGLKAGDPNWAIAEKEGFQVYNLWDAVGQADIIQVWY